MNYMRPFWENRKAAGEQEAQEAEHRLAKLALLEMDQQTLPWVGTEPCRLLGRLGVAIEAAMEDDHDELS